MPPPAASSQPPRSPRALLLEWAPLLLFGALLALRSWAWPGDVATTQTDDVCNQSFNLYFLEGARAGVDYVLTFGPLGFAFGDAYEPRIDTASLALRLGFALSYALAVSAGLLVVEGRRRRLLFAALALLIPPSLDRASLLFSLFAGVALLRSERPARIGLALVITTLAAWSLVKFSFTLTALGTGSLLLLHVAARRGLREASAWLGYAAGAFLLLWVASGQRVGDLPLWVHGALQTAAGYSESMGLADAPRFEALGLTACLAVAGALLLRGLGRWRQEALPALLTAALCFLAWKVGFVRQGSHLPRAFGFFALGPLILWRDLEGLGRLRRRALAGCVGLACACGVIGLQLQGPREERGLAKLAAGALRQLRGTVENLASPEERRFRLYNLARSRRVELSLPRVRRAVGEEGIDLLSVELGWLWHNDLRWQGRPVAQGYVTYRPFLAELNRRHFAAAGAPEFVLLDGYTLDGRLPALDDGPALLEVLRRYELVLVERGLPLLRRRAQPGPEPRLLRAWEGGLEQPIEVPEHGEGLLYLVLDLPLSALGRLRATLARGPLVEAEVTLRDGRRFRHRLIPSMARAGFLLDPFPRTLRDWGRLWNGGGAPRVRSLRLLVDADAQDEVGERYRVEAWTLAAPPAKGLDLRAGVAARRERYLGWPCQLAPASAQADPVLAPGLGPALLTRAPSTLWVEVPDEAATLHVFCGVRSLPYDRTRFEAEGIVFSVEGEGGAELWRRELWPAREPGDRELQRLEGLALPPGQGRRLALKTRAAADERWGSCGYWGVLRFCDAEGRWLARPAAGDEVSPH